jgi:hypothetical protein
VDVEQDEVDGLTRGTEALSRLSKVPRRCYERMLGKVPLAQLEVGVFVVDDEDIRHD